MILACHLGRYIPPSQATYACDPGRSPTGDAATWGREKEAYARAGYPLATAELPDYLPLVLEFALEVPEEGSPMLAENRAAIEVIRRSLRHDGSLYAHLIEALIFFLPALTEETMAEMQKFIVRAPVEECGPRAVRGGRPAGGRLGNVVFVGRKR